MYSAGNATATTTSKPVKHKTHLQAGIASLRPLLGMLQLEKLANQRSSKAQNPPGSRRSESHTTAGGTEHWAARGAEWEEESSQSEAFHR